MYKSPFFGNTRNSNFQKGGFFLINKVEICGVDTSKLPILSNEEKIELLNGIKKGDKEARTKFINGNLRLVLSVIRRFFSKGENADDLFQIGCVGLIKAIDNFEMEQNVQFSTYAVPMIIGELRRFLRDNNVIRVSRSLRDLAYKSLGAKEALAAKLDREPTVEEIAKELNVPKEEIVNALDAIVDPISLYDPVFSENGDSVYVMDQISDTKNTDENWLQKIAISEAIKNLSDRERSIIELRFFEGKTQMEVAQEIHISQAQVSRLEKSALKHMKKFI